MYAEFSDNLVTGNDLIDSQHKELIGKINELLKVCETKAGYREAVKMLEYLADYTGFHFGAEEKLQEEIAYPGIEAHKEEHKKFVKAIDELHEMLDENEGPTPEFVESVNRNVTEWLYKHIQGFDRSVAEYRNIRSNGELI